MNCTACPFDHQCRSLSPCRRNRLADADILGEYARPKVQKVVQRAAELVDHGKAGTMSRLEEIAEFSLSMGYRKVGLAYCWCMETEAAAVVSFLRQRNVPMISVSCTVGARSQSSINEASLLKGVSCDPLSQAEQLKQDQAELVITMGLCLGHDILLNRYLHCDVTTLVVKDRTTDHNPIAAIRRVDN